MYNQSKVENKPKESLNEILDNKTTKNKEPVTKPEPTIKPKAKSQKTDVISNLTKKQKQEITDDAVSRLGLNINKENQNKKDIQRE